MDRFELTMCISLAFDVYCSILALAFVIEKMLKLAIFVWIACTNFFSP